MKKIYLFLIPFVVFAACKKELHPGASLGNPTNYQMVSMIYSGSPSSGTTLLMTYDPSTHLLTDYQYIQWGVATVVQNGNSQVSSWADTTFFHFEYSEGRASRMYRYHQGDTGYLTYHYNGGGMIDTVMTYNADGQLQDGSSGAYLYNAGQELSDVIQFGSKGISSHFTYAYDAAGNLTNEVDSILRPQLWVWTYQYSGYDKKINLIKAINGFPVTYNGVNYFGVPSSFSSNNYGIVTSAGTVTPGGPPSGNTLDYTYVYNSAGLPTQMTFGSLIVTMTYQKY